MAKNCKSPGGLNRTFAGCLLLKAWYFFSSVWRFIRHCYTPVCLILGVCIPLFIFCFLDSSETKWRMLYIMLVMIVSWLSNAVNISVTALFPVVLLPLLGIISANDVATKYMKPSVLLYIGSSIMGTAMSKCGLDRRVALFVLNLAGPKEHRLLAGLMICSSFLSMWMSNTATAVMLLPVVGMIVQIVNDGRSSKQTRIATDRAYIGINEPEARERRENHTGGNDQNPDATDASPSINELLARDEGSPGALGPTSFETGACSNASSSFVVLHSSTSNAAIDPCENALANGVCTSPCFVHRADDCTPTVEHAFPNFSKGTGEDNFNETEEKGHPADKRSRAFQTMLYLALSYSCSIGGIATLTGTPTNTVLVGLLLEHYGSSHNPVTFAKWMFWAFPFSMVLLLSAWFIIQLVWIGPRRAIMNIMPTEKQLINIIKCVSVVPLQKCAKGCLFSLKQLRSKTVIRSSDAGREIANGSTGRAGIVDVEVNRGHINGDEHREVEGNREDLTEEDIERKVHREIRAKVSEAHRALGRWSFGEKIVCIVFVVSVVLLCTRSPDFVPGWGALLAEGFVDDSTVAVGIGLFFFFLPSNNVFKFCRRKNRPTGGANSSNSTTVGSSAPATAAVCADSLCSFPNELPSSSSCSPSCRNIGNSDDLEKGDFEPVGNASGRRSEDGFDVPYVPILSWVDAVNSIDWGVVLILGSGYALSAGIKVSHLDAWAAEQLAHLEVLPVCLIVLCVIVLTGLLTEVTSNVTTANIILPILFSASRAININPLLLCLAATAAASFAFMLPIASVCNTIAFQAGKMRTFDMIRTGMFVNFTGTFILLFFIYTWGYTVFDLAHPPIWM